MEAQKKDIEDNLIDEENGFDSVLPDLKAQKTKKKNTLTSKQAKALSLKAQKSPLIGKHGKHKKTLLLEEAYKQVQERLIQRSLKLIDTQTVIAHGTIKVYKMVSHFEGSGKNRKKVRGRPEIVTNEDEIAAAIDYSYGDGDNPTDEDEYFFVTTKDPDNKAIQSQVDRIFGKAAQSIDLTSAGKEIKQITGMQVVEEITKDAD